MAKMNFALLHYLFYNQPKPEKKKEIKSDRKPDLSDKILMAIGVSGVLAYCSTFVYETIQNPYYQKCVKNMIEVIPKTFF